MARFRKLPAAIVRQKSAIIKKAMLKPQNSFEYLSVFLVDSNHLPLLLPTPSFPEASQHG